MDCHLQASSPHIVPGEDNLLSYLNVIYCRVGRYKNPVNLRLLTFCRFFVENDNFRQSYLKVNMFYEDLNQESYSERPAVPVSHSCLVIARLSPNTKSHIEWWNDNQLLNIKWKGSRILTILVFCIEGMEGPQSLRNEWAITNIDWVRYWV